MSEENGHNSTNQAGPVSSSSLQTDKTPEIPHDQKDSEKSKGEAEPNDSVPFHKLFSFVDSIDIALMIVGTLAAVANGAAMPIMTILFGELTNSFGETVDTNKVVDEVSKVSLRPGVVQHIQSCLMQTTIKSRQLLELFGQVNGSSAVEACTDHH